MIDKLKKTEAGKRIYRASRVPYIGAPLRLLAWAVQHESIQPAHLVPANRAHNQTQRAVLAAFRDQTRR